MRCVSFWLITASRIHSKNATRAFTTEQHESGVGPCSESREDQRIRSERVADDFGSRAEYATTLPSPHSDDGSFTILLLKLLLSHKTISHSVLCLSFWGAQVPDWWPQRPSLTASGTCLGPGVLYGLFLKLHQTGRSVAPHPHPSRLTYPEHHIVELCCLDVSLPLFQQPGGPIKLLVHLNKIQDPPSLNL